jgi:two-component system, NarL family, sensor histidine kinase YdfH
MQRKAQYAGLLFYIFISVLLISLAVSGALAIFPVIPLPLAIMYILFFGVHLGLYWLNLKYYQNRRWAVFYYILQAVLIIALVNFPYNRDSVRISILGSTTMCMIGESLGLWGNTRRSLFLGLLYGGLAVALLFLLVERDVFRAAVSTLLFNAIFIVLFMIVLNQQFAEREKAEELAESLEIANAQLAAYSAKIEALTLQNERQRMARELHDTLAQGVAGLVLQLEAVKNHLRVGHNERALGIVEQSLIRARSTLDESRAAIDDLRAVPANLAESVRGKVDRFTQSTAIPCELDLSLQENGLATEVTDHALNILSEALANITRHAQATQVNVKFIVQNDGLELEVRDNGKGFDLNQETSAGHYGLLGMRERARLTGGTLMIESNPQSGTKVRFVVADSQGTR